MATAAPPSSFLVFPQKGYKTFILTGNTPLRFWSSIARLCRGSSMANFWHEMPNCGFSRKSGPFFVMGIFVFIAFLEKLEHLAQISISVWCGSKKLDTLLVDSLSGVKAGCLGVLVLRSKNGSGKMPGKRQPCHH